MKVRVPNRFREDSGSSGPNSSNFEFVQMGSYTQKPAYAISLLAPPEMAQGYAPELEEQKKPARELVERSAKKLRGAGFEARTAVEIGDVRVRILDTATEWHADLIVVGSHGLRGIESFLLGSVTESVARHAKCSVEIVRTPVGN